jgi:hypothetical protein
MHSWILLSLCVIGAMTRLAQNEVLPGVLMVVGRENLQLAFPYAGMNRIRFGGSDLRPLGHP